MDRQQKKTIIESHQKHQKDTGSPRVQIMILTERILEVTSHLEAHKKDNHSRRGLLKMVETRKKLLRYLENSKPEEHQSVVTEMEGIKSGGIKKTPAKKSSKPASKVEKPATKKTAPAKKSVAKKPAAKKTPAKKSSKSSTSKSKK